MVSEEGGEPGARVSWDEEQGGSGRGRVRGYCWGAEDSEEAVATQGWQGAVVLHCCSHTIATERSSRLGFEGLTVTPTTPFLISEVGVSGREAGPGSCRAGHPPKGEIWELAHLGTDPPWRGHYLGSALAWSRPAQMTDPPCPVGLQRSTRPFVSCSPATVATGEGPGIVSSQPGHRPTLRGQVPRGRTHAGPR